jgi:hypothetical protein
MKNNSDKKALAKMMHQARYSHDGEPLERRQKALRELRIVDGKNTSYGKFLHDYIRSMAFTYHASGANAVKYRRIIALVEDMAQKQWKNFKQSEIK